MRELTDAELSDMGRDLDSRYGHGFLIDGRTVTNVEMLALLRWHESERRRRIKADGCCCPEGPADDGYCRKAGGLCAAVIKAKRLLWRIDRGEK